MKKTFESFMGIWAIIGVIAVIVKFVASHDSKEIVGDILLPSLKVGLLELVKRMSEALLYGKPLQNKATRPGPITYQTRIKEL